MKFFSITAEVYNYGMFFSVCLFYIQTYIKDGSQAFVEASLKTGRKITIQIL